MKSLVIIFLACTALAPTLAVPVADNGGRIIMPGVISFERNFYEDTAPFTAFDSPLVFGNMHMPGRQGAIAFEEFQVIPVVDNNVEVTPDSNTDINPEISMKKGHTSPQRGRGVPSVMHFPSHGLLNNMHFSSKIPANAMHFPNVRPVYAMHFPSSRPVNKVPSPSETPVNKVPSPSETPVNNVPSPSKTTVNDVPFPSERPVNSIPSPSETTVNDVPIPSERPVNNEPFPNAGVSNDEGSGDSFLFPSIFRVDEQAEEYNRSESESSGEEPCGLELGSMYANDTCERFLARSSCPVGEWFVQVNDTAGKCVARPCPFGQLMYRGACVNATAEDVCNEEQMLYVDFTGYAQCDCQPHFIYDPRSGKCFAEGDQGYCNFGEQLYINESGVVECIKRRCIHHFVYHEGSCLKKLYRGFCEGGFIKVDLHKRTADCLAAYDERSIFDLPTMRSCPVGSIQDYTGSCRQSFRIPSMSSYPAPSGGCPPGFRRDSRGTCRKINRLFG